MRIGVHRHPQGALDVCHGRVDFQKHPVGMARRYSEPATRRPSDDSLIILHGGAEPGGELLRLEVVVVHQAGGIVELLEKVCERLPVVQWQVDRQFEPRRSVEAAQRLQSWNYRWQLAGQGCSLTWLRHHCGRCQS